MGTRGHETSCPGRCQLLAFQQLRAPLTLLRTGWLHSIMIFSPGAEQALIIHLHDGERGEEKKKKTRKKKKNPQKANPGFSDGQISHRPREAVRRLHSPRGEASSGSSFQVPAGPHPSARPASPARCGRPSWNWLPLAASGEPGWAPGVPTEGRRGVRWSRGGGGGGGDLVEREGRGKKARVAERKKKNSLARRKVLDHAGRRHESRRFEEWSSVPGGWLSPAGSARSDRSERSAARWRQSGRTALSRRGGGRGPGVRRGAGGGAGDPGKPTRRPFSSPAQRQIARIRGAEGSISLMPPLRPPQIPANAETAKANPTPPTRNWESGALEVLEG